MKLTMYTTFYQTPKDNVMEISDPIAMILGQEQKQKLRHLQNFIKKRTIVEELDVDTLFGRLKYFEETVRIPNDYVDTLINAYKDVLEYDRPPLYTVYKIPKRSGGYREITAPNEELKNIQRAFARLLEYNLHILPHQSAMAFIKGQGIATNAEFHKLSNHFCKVDFSNFFPSITKNLIHNVLPMIYPFTLTKLPKEMWTTNVYELSKIMKILPEVATYNGVLPQGSPLSPILSNIIAIPLDYHITERLQNLLPKTVLYTRYVDDLVFSSFYKIGVDKDTTANIIKEIITRAQENAYYHIPFIVKDEKTTVSTHMGKNRITGIKVNQEHKTSIGYKEKQQLKQDLAKIIILKAKTGEKASNSENIIGMLAFLNAIEPEYATYMERTLLRKMGLKDFKSINEFLNT